MVILDDPVAERKVFLSTLSASRRQIRWALVVAVASLCIFLLCAPFAQVRLPEERAFIPSYQGAYLAISLITATLLFAQFAILAAPSLLILASGYLFAGLISIPHALSYPHLFARTGVIGGGQQTAAWLYMFWHAGFPLAVIGYSLLRDSPRARRPRMSIAVASAVVVALIVGICLLTTAGNDLLPTIMRGDRYTTELAIITGAVCAIVLLALLLLWKLRPYSVLDVLLMVVMSAWLFELGLSAILSAGRFDFGFYAGRVYGLLAATLVLLILLIQTGVAYARLARSFAAETRAREHRFQQLQAELIHVSRSSALGQMVTALAHEVIQPLTALDSYVRAGRRLLLAGDLANTGEALSRAIDQVTRASQVIQRLRQFVRDTDGPRDAADLRQTVEEAAALALFDGARGIELATEFEPGVPPVLIDTVQIQQVLLNLIRNAVEAMRDERSRQLTIRTMRSADRMAEVSVGDSGPGLPAVVREKLFQPFVTTKPSGIGLGLSLCRDIIEAHGGRIWQVDRPGGGAEFHFTLPAAASSLERAGA